jgi:hypothetical protein
MRQALDAVENMTGERVYVGNDIWVTTYPDGSENWEILCTETEDATLRAAAAAAGVTVEQLMKNRLLQRPDHFDDMTAH